MKTAQAIYFKENVKRIIVIKAVGSTQCIMPQASQCKML